MSKVSKIFNIFLMIIILSLSFQSFLIKTVSAQNCIRAIPILTGEISKCDGILYPESLVKEHLLLQVKAEELSQKLKVTMETCNQKILECEKYLAKAEKKIGNRIKIDSWYNGLNSKL